MHKFFLYAALLLLTQCAGCKVNDPFPHPQPLAKPIDQLPPATQTGQYTFSCLLNGQTWVQAGNPANGPLFTAHYSSKHLSLIARGKTIVTSGVSTGGIIQIDIDNINTTGLYTLISRDISFANYDDLTNRCSYYTEAAHPATVQITRLDPVARIVSGTFAFTLNTPGCGPVVVTDGRFDARF